MNLKKKDIIKIPIEDKEGTTTVKCKNCGESVVKNKIQIFRFYKEIKKLSNVFTYNYKYIKHHINWRKLVKVETIGLKRSIVKVRYLSGSKRRLLKDH